MRWINAILVIRLSCEDCVMKNSAESARDHHQSSLPGVATKVKGVMDGDTVRCLADLIAGAALLGLPAVNTAAQDRCMCAASMHK